MKKKTSKTKKNNKWVIFNVTNIVSQLLMRFHLTNMNTEHKRQRYAQFILKWTQWKKSISFSSIRKAKEKAIRGQRRGELDNLMPKISQTNVLICFFFSNYRFRMENINWIALNEQITTKRGEKKAQRPILKTAKVEIVWWLNVLVVVSLCIHCIQWHLPSMILDFAIRPCVCAINIQHSRW